MVRATFAGMSTALSAIQANQKRLDVVGQNLSNLNTVGYTRQQLETSSLNYSNPIAHYMNGSEIAVGFGVSMDRVSQIRDPYLDAQYRAQMGKSGYTDGFQTSLDTLAKALDESDIKGINMAFNNIQSTLQEMQDLSKVNDAIYESELRSRMQALSNLFNDTARQIQDAEAAEYSRLDGTGTSEQGAVQKVNDLLRQIGDLNHQIKSNQILGQPSLELLDDRNRMLDELASYVPIKVSYFKDSAHDGKTVDPTTGATLDAPKELYDYDSKGNIIGRKDWPDDLKVELAYQEGGATKYLTLVDGTNGTSGKNYGSISVGTTTTGNLSTAFIKATAAASSVSVAATPPSISASATGVQFSGGSIQAGLDMLGKKGTGGADNVKGYQYYMKRLDTVAKHFADTMNEINKKGNNGTESPLLANKDDPTEDITALTIGISNQWTSGTVHIGTGSTTGGTTGGADDSANSTVLNMLEAMKKTYTELGDKSFADYMNNVSTVLANDSSNNTNALKTNVTVLNSIQSSRDSVSGVSLDEEASNMMAYTSAYNAASRLMTALDELLNTLISGTGLVGR